METRYHIEILTEALGDTFSPRALEEIIRGNVAQDRLRGQIGHDEYHFDNNAFEAGYAYIEKNRAEIPAALERGNPMDAWAAFGRLTHAAQDFYAHSNYVTMWMARFDSPPPLSEIDPMDESLLRSPALRSGKIYYPLEAFTYLPFLRRFVLPFLPRDSHAWMNLDSPERGEAFFYAKEAAVKRTRVELTRVFALLSPQMRMLFLDSPA